MQFAEALTGPQYDVAFADPPYNSKMLDRVVTHWHATHFARVLAVEHAKTHDLPEGSFRQVMDDTAITIYTAPAGPA